MNDLRGTVDCLWSSVSGFSWWQAVLLGVLQGITEFLPISSSGHLVLAQHFLGFEKDAAGKEAALLFDGCLHLGTLFAVVLYFRKEVRQQLVHHLGKTGGDEPHRSPWRLPRSKEGDELAPWPVTWADLWHVAALVALATLPAALTAVLMGDHIKASFANPLLVSVDLLVLGFILLLADRRGHGRTTGPQTTWWQALLIGVAQALSAVFRGLSRSGLTVSAALAVGLQREWAVRFSFLLSVVASLGLGSLGIIEAAQDPEVYRWLTPEFLLLTLLGTVVSGVVGYLTIDPLIRLVRRCRLWWFSLYLWLLGGTLLLHFWKG